MTDDNLTPVARACIETARRALATANAHLHADRLPYVPAELELPAERVQEPAPTTPPEVAGERVQGEAEEVAK